MLFRVFLTYKVFVMQLTNFWHFIKQINKNSPNVNDGGPILSRVVDPPGTKGGPKIWRRPAKSLLVLGRATTRD